MFVFVFFNMAKRRRRRKRGLLIFLFSQAKLTNLSRKERLVVFFVWSHVDVHVIN